jgi:hypothetical protein
MIYFKKLNKQRLKIFFYLKKKKNLKGRVADIPSTVMLIKMICANILRETADNKTASLAAIRESWL